MKRITATALAIVTCLALAACGPDEENPNDDRGDLQKCLEDNSGLGC